MNKSPPGEAKLLMTVERVKKEIVRDERASVMKEARAVQKLEMHSRDKNFRNSLRVFLGKLSRLTC
jgi:hypothetical protein